MDNLARVKALLEQISARDTDSSFRKEAKDLLNKLDNDVMLGRIKELEAENEAGKVDNDVMKREIEELKAEITDNRRELLASRFMMQVLDAQDDDDDPKARASLRNRQTPSSREKSKVCVVL